MKIITKKADFWRKILLLSLLVASVVFIWSLIGCPFRFLFGIPCPGCGMTRAYGSLLTGHWRDAFHWHPLFIPLPAMLALYILNPPFLRRKWVNRTFLAVLLVMSFGTYAIRMLTLFPHTDPMIYNSNAVVNKIFIFGRGLLT